MDQRELHGDLSEAVRLVVRAALLDMQTAMPVHIVEYNALGAYATCQPTTRAYIPSQDGSFKWVQLPLLIYVPVIFPRGGGYTLTFPIKPGDEGLCVFSSRAIDAWWTSGGIQNQVELRHHDLSDGFVIVGPRSQANLMLAPASQLGPELRSDDGLVKIGLDILGVSITAPLTTITGALQVSGGITTAVPGAISTGDVSSNAAGDSGSTTSAMNEVATSYDYTQSTPSMMWDIVHNLNSFPSVTVLDSAGHQMHGDVRYISRNELTCSFTATFAGTAHLV